MNVHNHGPAEGRGLDCPERMVDGKLRGGCMAAEVIGLSALDFVKMYLSQTEGHPQNGHYVNAVACRRAWPRKDDARSRCPRCDGEALLGAPDQEADR